MALHQDPLGALDDAAPLERALELLDLVVQLADVGHAHAHGDDGLIDDDVADARPWGFDVSQVAVPVLLVHGELDRMIPRRHASWLLSRIPAAKLWARLDDGHVSVLDVVPDAMDWLLAGAAPLRP